MDPLPSLVPSCSASHNFTSSLAWAIPICTKVHCMCVQVQLNLQIIMFYRIINFSHQRIVNIKFGEMGHP